MNLCVYAQVNPSVISIAIAGCTVLVFVVASLLFAAFFFNMALRVMPGIEESVERQWMQEQSKVEELRTVCQATAQNWR